MVITVTAWSLYARQTLICWHSLTQVATRPVYNAFTVLEKQAELEVGDPVW